MVRIRVFTDPAVFLDHAADFIARDPLSTDVIAKVSANLAASGATAPDDVWLCATDEAGTCVGAAIFDPPWNLTVSRMPPGVATALADTLAERGAALPGVFGADAAVTEFAARWAELHTCDVRLVGLRNVDVLDVLVPPTDVPGTARRFTEGDVEVVAAWLAAFHDEAVPDDPALDTAVVAAERIGRDELWGWWVADEPVSLVACALSPGGTARIGPVYTPPDRRGRGYAGAATAVACRAALDAGARPVLLLADTQNPTSNALYERLGFRRDHVARQVAFV